MRKQLFLTLMAAALPLGAIADNAAPAGDPQDSMAPMTCKKPAFVSSLRKVDDDSDFQGKVQAYQECVQAYAGAQNKLAQMHASAANAAIGEFNAFIKEYNERQDAKAK